VGSITILQASAVIMNTSTKSYTPLRNRSFPSSLEWSLSSDLLFFRSGVLLLDFSLLQAVKK